MDKGDQYSCMSARSKFKRLHLKNIEPLLFLIVLLIVARFSCQLTIYVYKSTSYPIYTSLKQNNMQRYPLAQVYSFSPY